MIMYNLPLLESLLLKMVLCFSSSRSFAFSAWRMSSCLSFSSWRNRFSSWRMSSCLSSFLWRYRFSSWRESSFFVRRSPLKFWYIFTKIFSSVSGISIDPKFIKQYSTADIFNVTALSSSGEVDISFVWIFRRFLNLENVNAWEHNFAMTRRADVWRGGIIFVGI